MLLPPPLPAPTPPGPGGAVPRRGVLTPGGKPRLGGRTGKRGVPGVEERPRP